MAKSSHLRPQQIDLLKAVYRRSGAGDMGYLDHNSAEFRKLQRLEKKGLVAPDSGEGRWRVRWCITDEGERRLKQMQII